VLAAAVLPVAVFVVGTTTAFFAPAASLFIWCLAFVAPLLGWLLTRRRIVSRKDNRL
jgi:hypothetical protein